MMGDGMCMVMHQIFTEFLFNDTISGSDYTASVGFFVLNGWKGSGRTDDVEG